LLLLFGAAEAPAPRARDRPTARAAARRRRVDVLTRILLGLG
jgi:hypothetical protein